MLQENSSLEVEIRRLSEQLQKQEERYEANTRTESKNSVEIKPEVNLNGGAQSLDKEFSQSEKQEAFKFLGLPLASTSQEIAQRYKTLKTEYEALISNCPRGLRDICELRLQGLENAFGLIFPEREKEEDQRVERAFEMLQLSRGTDKAKIVKRFRELTDVCLKAMKSSDAFIKEAAAKELEKLEEAIPVLVPEELMDGSMAEVVMPQMGESITEGTITKWLKREGEPIDRDEPLFEISTEKVDAEIPSPVAGVLKKILVAEGETVEVNYRVAWIKLPEVA
jgi:biotin carboxyl carrier protein